MDSHKFDKVIDWNVDRYRYFRDKAYAILEMCSGDLPKEDQRQVEYYRKRRDRIGSFIVTLDYQRNVDNGVFDEDDVYDEELDMFT